MKAKNIHPIRIFDLKIFLVKSGKSLIYKINISKDLWSCSTPEDEHDSQNKDLNELCVN